MATATVNIVPAKPGRWPRTSELNLRLDHKLFETLLEMARFAFSGERKLESKLVGNTNVLRCEGRKVLETFAAMLLESSIAEFRLRKIPNDFLIRKEKTPDPPLVEDQRQPHWRRPSQQDEEKIVISLLEGVKVEPCAQRFGRGASTIRRIWKRRGPSPETIQTILHLNGKAHDGSESIGGIRAIAQKCGVSENIANAIIKNLKPLTPFSTVVGRGYQPENIAHKRQPSWERGTKNGSETHNPND
jgi:hypothetical protein